MMWRESSQVVPRCFFCDTWLDADGAFLTRLGRVFGQCCADVAASDRKEVAS